MKDLVIVFIDFSGCMEECIYVIEEYFLYDNWKNGFVFIFCYLYILYYDISETTKHF